MHPGQALRRAGLATLLTLAASAAVADGYTVKNSKGAEINLRGHTLGTSDVLPYTGLTDQAGNAISPLNPLSVAPGIATVLPKDRSGAITAAGAVALDILGNSSRRGGWIQAGLGNTGIITVTMKNPDGTTHADQMWAGSVITFQVNGGYVIQTEILVSGDTVGDKFTGVEFQ